MRKSIVLVSFLSLFCSVLSAEYIDYNKAISILSDVTSKDFPEANNVYIINERVKLNKKCVGTVTFEYYDKILTNAAKKDNEVKFFYDADYDTLEVTVIEIIKSDGKRITFDPKKILKLTGSPGYANIYTKSSKILTAQLPDLSIGDIIHTVKVKTIKKARMRNHFSDKLYIENYYQCLKQYYEVSLPKEIKLNIHYINKKEGFVTTKHYKKGKMKFYTWVIDAAPQLIREPNMEHNDKFSYYIVLTTSPDWQTISRYCYSLAIPHLEPSEEMKNKVAELIADAKTKEEKISNIFYWVAQKIRYVGIDKEDVRPGYEPHDVAYTFSTRGGVCRDKAILLMVMLRMAGIPSDPILITRYLNPSAPVMWFVHEVALSYDENGEPEHFFDPTNENAKDYFPQYQEDHSYLIASEKGDSLRVIPISPSSKNNTNIDIKIKIDKTKKATCFSTTKYSGLGDNFIRSYLMRLTPKEKKEMIERSIALIHPQAKLKDYTITDPQNKDENIKIQFEFDIPNYLTEEGKYVFLPLEATKFSLSYYFDYHMKTFRLNERKYPFKLPGTFSVDISESVEFDLPITDISIPKIAELNYKGFKLSTSFEKNEKILKFTTHLSADQIHYKQEDFLPLKNKLSQLEQLEKLYIIGRWK